MIAKIRIDSTRDRISPNLFGMDYRIEQVNKKYHPDLICEVVLSALAEVYSAGSSTR